MNPLPSLLFAGRNGFIRAQRKLRLQQKQSVQQRRARRKALGQQPLERQLYNDLVLEKVDIVTGDVLETIGLSSLQWNSPKQNFPEEPGLEQKVSEIE